MTYTLHRQPRCIGSAAILLGVAAALGALTACGGEKKSTPASAAAATDSTTKADTAPSTPPVPPQQFASAREAAAAIVAAAGKFDLAALKTILGSQGAPLLETSDRVADSNNAVAFAAEAHARQHLVLDSTKTIAILSVGARDWPLPIPIVQQDGKWSFDARRGADEILARRIGRNEFDAIDVCRGYVRAQHSYALARHDGSLLNQYAQRVISTPGKHDGLAWQGRDSSWQGPLGVGIARVISEGYSTSSPTYHGYYFKILKGQGPAAPLGQMDFRVKGAMIGGFGLVAAPAQYLVSGVKTFIVSHDGVVYEKDLGEHTLDEFRMMERYNPDSTWTPVPAQ